MRSDAVARSRRLRASLTAMSAVVLAAGVLAAPAARGASSPAPPDASIAVGFNHVVLLTADGRPYAAGSSEYGAIGVSGTAGGTLPLTPMQGLPGGVAGTSVAAGFETSYVLGTDGRVYGTGFNGGGGLGVGDTGPNRFALTPLPGLPAGVRAVAASAGFQYVMVLGSNGIPYAAGAGAAPLSGPARSTLAPMVGLPAGRRIVAVAAGRTHAVVLDSDGRVYGTGANATNGQITGSVDRPTLTEFSGMPQGVRMTAIAAGDKHTMMLGSDRNVYVVGNNDDGQLGLGSFNGPRRQPARMRGVSDAVGIAAGQAHSVVVTSGGAVLGVGKDSSGQLTTGTTPAELEPLRAASSADPMQPVVEVAAQQLGTVVRDADAVVFGTGINDYRQHDGATFLQVNGLTRYTGQPIASVSAPVVTGTRGVGSRLGVTGARWAPSPSAQSYVWLDGSTVLSTSSTYVPGAAQAGRSVRVRVTATRPGFTTAERLSASVAIPLHNTRAPSIRGTAKVGKRLTASVGSWTPRPSSYRYQWLRNGKPISKATSRRYTVSKRDRKARVSVRVTALRSGSASGVSVSRSTKVR